MAEGGNSKGAMLGLIIGTVVAIGSGFGVGALMLKKPEPGAAATAAPAAAKEAKVPESEVRPLASIVTNLGNPPDLFVRLQAAVVLEPNTPESAALITKIGDDVVAYLRTVSIAEIQGPTGFQFLREDLKKRAIQLGGGKVRDFLLTTFVIE
jgi:flagellar FliL protein